MRKVQCQGLDRNLCRGITIQAVRFPEARPDKIDCILVAEDIPHAVTSDDDKLVGSRESRARHIWTRLYQHHWDLWQDDAR